jgi:CHAD domain-containing protein
MKVLLIMLLVEIGVVASLVLLQLEAIKDEIVSAITDKAALNAVYGKFSQATRLGDEGRVPDLDVMAQAKIKAEAHLDTTHERAGVFKNGDPR